MKTLARLVYICDFTWWKCWQGSFTYAISPDENVGSFTLAFSPDENVGSFTLAFLPDENVGSFTLVFYPMKTLARLHWRFHPMKTLAHLHWRKWKIIASDLPWSIFVRGGKFRRFVDEYFFTAVDRFNGCCKNAKKTIDYASQFVTGN